MPKFHLKLSTGNPNTNRFLKDLLQNCKKHNIGFLFSYDEHIEDEDGLKSKGYFDDKNIAIALKNSNWLDVLVHESCHFDQMIEKVKVYKAFDKMRYSMFDWLNGRNFTDKYVKRLVETSRNCELDCEIRTVNKIKKYKLPIQIAPYVKRANSYILFYNYIMMTRKWYVPGKEPYSVKQIINKMSDDFDMDYENLDEDLICLFEQCVK